MASIGSASLLISTDPTALNTGLTQVQASINTRFQAIGTSISAFSVASGTLIAGIFTGIAARASGALQGVLGEVTSAIKIAKGLNIDVGAFQAFAHAAGDSETAAAALGKLAKALGEARAGSQEAQRSFLRLGIEFNDVKDKNPVEAFHLVAESIASMGNGMDRARAATAIFGRSGLELLPILSRGSAGLAEMEARARELGIVMSSEDASRIRDASKAFKEVKLAVQGFTLDLASAFAPAFTAMSKLATEIRVATRPAFAAILEGAKVATDFFKFSVDRLINYLKGIDWKKYFGFSAADLAGGSKDAVESFLKLMTGTAATIAGVFVEVGKTITNAIVVPLLQAMIAIGEMQTRMRLFGPEGQRLFKIKGGLFGAIFGDSEEVETEGEKSTNALKALVERLQGSLNAIDTGSFKDNLDKLVNDFIASTKTGSAAVATAAAESRAGIISAILDVEEKLREEGATWMMSAEAIERRKLVMLGATNEELAGLDRIIREKERVAEIDRMSARANEVVSGLMTPLEKYQEEIDKLNELVEAGNISWEIYARGVDKALAELDKMERAEVKTPNALAQGSREAVQTIVKAQLQTGGQESQQARVQRIMENQRDIQQESLNTQRELLRVFRGGEIGLVF